MNEIDLDVYNEDGELIGCITVQCKKFQPNWQEMPKELDINGVIYYQQS